MSSSERAWTGEGTSDSGSAGAPSQAQNCPQLLHRNPNEMNDGAWSFSCACMLQSDQLGSAAVQKCRMLAKASAALAESIRSV